MKKLKDILLEGYAWERRPGKPLPTLAEVQAEYQRNEAAKPDFLDLDKDGDKEESMKSATHDMNKEDKPEDVNETTLRNNLRRFGVKNLKENAFEGEPIEPAGDTVTAYGSDFDPVNLSVNGQMRQLLWMNKGKSLQQVLSLAREEDAYLPTRDELDSLQKSIKPGETVGEIWIDQGPSAPANMQYVLFNLSDGSDVMVVNQGQGPRDTYSQHVVLLRKTPMKRPVTVSPKR